MEIYEKCPRLQSCTRLTELSPVTMYGLTKLGSLVHEVGFWTKSDTNQWIVIITIETLCCIIALVTSAIKT